MDNLRELTFDKHKTAERMSFIRRITKKTITPKQYYIYLANQLLIYTALEDVAEKRDVLIGIENVKRANNISKDLAELEIQHGFVIPSPLGSTLEYCEYVKSLTDSDKIMAHIYTRHMADLSGGQTIAKLIPGEGLYYKFDEDIIELKAKIRQKLHDGLLEESRICFDMIIAFMAELDEYVENME